MSGKFFAACIVVSIAIHAVILLLIVTSRQETFRQSDAPVFVSIISRIASSKAAEGIKRQSVRNSPYNQTQAKASKPGTDQSKPDNLTKLSPGDNNTVPSLAGSGQVQESRGSGDTVTGQVGSPSGPVGGSGNSEPLSDIPSISKARHVAINIRYDETSRQRGEQGTVQIKAEIGKKGEILKTVISSSSGFPRLDRIAVNAIRSARFTPTLKNGDPVKSEVEYKIVFRLDGQNSLKVVEDDNVRIIE